MNKNQRQAFSLVEIVVAVFIVSLVSVPIYYLFSTSTKMNVTARHMAVAIGLSNSLLNTIKALPPELMYELPATPDSALSGSYDINSLGIPPCPEGIEAYKRYLQVVHKTWPSTNKDFFHIAVRVTWINPISKAEQSYVIQTLHPCPEES